MNDATTTSILKYGRWETDANTLPPKAISYLLHNGFTQSMTDAAATTREDKAKVLREGGHEADAVKMESGDGKALSTEGATHLATAVDKWRQERFDAIMSGTVGTRVGGGGPRKDPLVRTMEDIAEERLRAHCSVKQVAMPKGDVLKQALAIILRKGGEALKAEAQARLQQASAMADELGDLFEAPATGEATA